MYRAGFSTLARRGSTRGQRFDIWWPILPVAPRPSTARPRTGVNRPAMRWFGDASWQELLRCRDAWTLGQGGGGRGWGGRDRHRVEPAPRRGGGGGRGRRPRRRGGTRGREQDQRGRRPSGRPRVRHRGGELGGRSRRAGPLDLRRAR